MDVFEKKFSMYGFDTTEEDPVLYFPEMAVAETAEFSKNAEFLATNLLIFDANLMLKAMRIHPMFVYGGQNFADELCLELLDLELDLLFDNIFQDAEQASDSQILLASDTEYDESIDLTVAENTSEDMEYTSSVYDDFINIPQS
jgi:hypothetical protein